MEGISGIVNSEQTNAGKAMFEEGRRLYTEEINAAIRGAKAGGATEIVVMDCHGAGDGYSWNSLIAEDLDPDCEFVVQDQWTGYTAFLESGCDAALFVGMHAMAGTADGVLNHTVSGRDWQNLWFNDTLVGETGINAALCGTWGCPVLLVTGDEAACREAKALLGEGLTTVSVKEGLSALSARMLAPARARELVEGLLALAVQDSRAYEQALTALERRDSGLARALAKAAEVPLAIAGTAGDVAELAAEAAERADGHARADAAAAAALAAGA